MEAFSHSGPRLAPVGYENHRWGAIGPFNPGPPITPSTSCRPLQDRRKSRRPNQISHEHKLPRRCLSVTAGLADPVAKWDGSSRFLDPVKGPLDLRSSDVDTIAQHLRSQLNTNRNRIHAAFKECDRRNKGTVNREQLDWVLLNYFQAMISEPQLDRLVQLFDNHGDERVDVCDFLMFHSMGTQSKTGRHHYKMRTRIF